MATHHKLLLMIVLMLLTACTGTDTTTTFTTLVPQIVYITATPRVVKITATPQPTLLSPTPTEEPPLPTSSSVQFKLFQSPNNSILPKTDLRDLNGTYQDPGAAIFHEGQFHLFYNSSHSYPPDKVHIGYAVSTDGYNWTRVSEESIIFDEDIPYEVSSILAGAVIVEPDGSWVLYFYTRDSLNSTPTSRIGRATAPSPNGPWQVDPYPVLEPDESGWASSALQRPDVIRVGDTYFMYFVGIGEQNHLGMIGMATSTDGINWTKYDDPATTSELFSLSDPVFTQENLELDNTRIKYPRVRHTGEGWLLFYQTSFSGGGDSRLWLATSPDGISWEPFQDEPILSIVDLPEATTIFLPNIVYAHDTYFIFVELAFGSYSRVNLVTYEGSLHVDAAYVGVPNPLLAPQIIDDHNIPMVLVPAGLFQMGHLSGSNGPVHSVILSDYYIDEFEVSNAHFADFLNEMGNQEESGSPWLDITSNRAEGHLHQVDGTWTPDEGYGDHPIVEVTWYGANAFCAWRGARLPTEAEWEKAARGDDERRFPWGDEASCDFANYRSCGYGETMPIDSYPRGISPFGVYNLAGNVSEWTADWYAPYPNHTVVDPVLEEATGSHVRVVRGGSWYSPELYLATYQRNSEFHPLSSFSNLGFRCALTP